MSTWPGLFLALLLLVPSLAAERPQAPGEAGRLQADLDAILQRTVECHQRGGGSGFLQAALRVAEVRTHPGLQAPWGRSGGDRGLGSRLLLAAGRLRGSCADGKCPPAGGEGELVRLAGDFIRGRGLFRSDSAQAAFSDPGSIARLKQALSPGQLLLKYVLLPDRVLVFCIHDGGAGCEVLPFGRAQVADMVQRLSRPLEAFAAGQVDYLRIHFDMELAHRLYNVLLRAVVERHPLASELVIVPDGELFKLPFEALVTGFRVQASASDALFSEYEDAFYLIQDFRVSYLVSLGDLLLPFAAAREYPYELVAFGAPLPPAEPPPDARSTAAAVVLTSTRQEVIELGKLFGGSRRRVFLGGDFNWENFSRFAPQARLLHLASHFFVDRGNPQRSAFLFSAGEGESAFCNAGRLHGLSMAAELVVLSACETSEKDLLGFKRLVGVTAAFRSAGVRSLIASLWPVDEFSSQMVTPFYREYLACRDGAAALRAAKLDLLGRTVSLRDGSRLSMAHPFLWANFVLYRFCR